MPNLNLQVQQVSAIFSVTLGDVYSRPHRTPGGFSDRAFSLSRQDRPDDRPPRTWSRKGRCLRAFADRLAWARIRVLDALQDALVDRAVGSGTRPIPRTGPTTGKAALRRAIAEQRWQQAIDAHFRR